jgi:soluble lytic murein transglycosylase-like protein
MGTTLSELQSEATSAAQSAGVPVQLFLDQINAESGFNPSAIGGTAAAGGQYAQGIAQFLPSTAASVGLANPYDPAQALPAAAAYDASLYSKTGSWVSALLGYGTTSTAAGASLNASQQTVQTEAQSLDAAGIGLGSTSAAATQAGAAPAAAAPSNTAAASGIVGWITAVIPDVVVIVIGVGMVYIGLTRGGTGATQTIIEPIMAAAK